MSLLQIMEGWKNHLAPAEELRDIIATVSKQRMSICHECQYHSKNASTIRPDDHCTLCGCPDVGKTKCLSCICPDEKPKWLPIDVEETKTNTDE